MPALTTIVEDLHHTGPRKGSESIARLVRAIQACHVRVLL